MNRALTRILLPLRQYALFSQASGHHDAACRTPTHCLLLALAIAVVVTLCSHAQATERFPISKYDVDQALRTSDVVIRGRVIGGARVGLRPDDIFPGSGAPGGRLADFPAFSVKVEKVLSGWYWGDVIQVVSLGPNDRFQCKMDDEVVVCANFRESIHRFVIHPEGFLVLGEKRKWWSRSLPALEPLGYSVGEPIGYTKKEIKELTRQRNVMK
jgi:hypothetical protein